MQLKTPPSPGPEDCLDSEEAAVARAQAGRKHDRHLFSRSDTSQNAFQTWSFKKGLESSAGGHPVFGSTSPEEKSKATPGQSALMAVKVSGFSSYLLSHHPAQDRWRKCPYSLGSSGRLVFGTDTSGTVACAHGAGGMWTENMMLSCLQVCCSGCCLIRNVLAA